MHLAIDHHLHRGRRDADKADHRQQAGKQAFDAVDPPQLNTDQKHGADIEEVERSVVKRAGDRLQRRKKGERGKLASPFFGSSTILEISTEKAPTMITGIRVINADLIAIM